MNAESIVAWVNALEGASPNPLEPICDPTTLNFPETARKRRKISSQSLTSATFAYIGAGAGEGTNTKSSPRKKPRLGSEDAVFNPDATPRPGSRSISPSASVATSDTNSVSRSRSRTSSVKRQMMRLRLGETGIDYQPLNETTVPDVAKMLFLTMTEYGRCQRILPDALKQHITETLKMDEILCRQWQYCFKTERDPADDLPGRIPSLEEIQTLLAMATECERHKHEEASWNAEVHLRLLHGVFRTLVGKQYGEFNAMLCSTARPHADFRPILSNSKMIDICVYASLDQNNEIDAVAKFCRTAPTLSINHTDFEPLQLRPIILSIETKKHGAESDKAQLQIGVWHAAQWNFLQWAVHEKFLQRRQGKGRESPLTTNEEAEVKTKTLTALSKLPFIPGIIIQGNYWKLVISTYAEGKTRLWSGFVFGKTESLMDIYAIVAGVRELTAWGRDTYLPWFRENILTLE
ncbi:hypothetical protein J3F83DRAFT_733295 [Trichoderma novae-zelandiae]